MIRLLSKLWILWSDCCQNYKYCDQIVVKTINVVIRFFTKLEALHHGQCEGTIKVTGFCSFSNKSQSFLVRNNFAASPATNPNKFLVRDKHSHNVRHLYDKETNRHKRSNKSTPIFSFILQLRIVWFKTFLVTCLVI